MVNPTKPWLKNYPDGVAHDIGVLPNSSLSQFLEECFSRFGNRKAVESMGKFFSYRDLEDSLKTLLVIFRPCIWRRVHALH